MFNSKKSASLQKWNHDNCQLTDLVGPFHPSPPPPPTTTTHTHICANSQGFLSSHVVRPQPWDMSVKTNVLPVNFSHTREVPMFVPKSSSKLQKFTR